MDPTEFRAQFPVFERIAYLNAGTCGPLPAASLKAGADSALAAAEQGRGMAYFEAMTADREAVRGHYADAIGAEAADVALTTATTDGMVRVLQGLELRPGDEIVTADDEHPGLTGPLAAARRHLGVTVRAVPLARIHEAVVPGRTRLVACSHVSWITGALAPAELAEVGREVPILLDGAQGAGAVPIDLGALNCAFYTGAGQKWLCGPVGTGLLWIAPAWREQLKVLAPGYVNLSVPSAGLDAEPWADARAFDALAWSGQVATTALAAVRTLAEPGWPVVHAAAAGLAGELADRLSAAGHSVLPRGASTLVSWEDPDAEATSMRLAAAGVIVRHLPGCGLLRASVGAWNAPADLDRLLGAL